MTGNNPKILVIDLEDTPVNLSPMASLAVDLSDTSLSATPTVRIRGKHSSTSSVTPDTPVSSFFVDVNEGRAGTPRMSKGMSRTPAGKCTLMRRLNSDPVTSTVTESKKDSNKENDGKTTSSPVKGEPGKSILRSLLRCHDANSQDSGFAQDDPYANFRFVEPCGLAPKRVEPSPRKCIDLVSSSLNVNSDSNLKSLSEGKVTGASFCSSGSYDDGFLELTDIDKSFSDENNSEYPMGMDNLLKGPLLDLNDTIPVIDIIDCEDEEDQIIVSDEDQINVSDRPPLRRVNSLMENYNSSVPSKARVGLFKDAVLSPGEFSPLDKVPFKRPLEVENNSGKRRKYTSYGIAEKPGTTDPLNPRSRLQRSMSDSAAFSLASAMHKPDLIADFTRPYALPVISGRHEDLKSISAETLADLINGNYSHCINSYRIIDCRYPYEYEGGHIKGSINLYTKEQVQQELFDKVPRQDNWKEGSADGRNILIFHCEFSLERGPTLYRFLRRCDRNMSSYPSLQYPEVYLLDGGYESFFSSYKSLCEPCAYQPMVDPKHESDLKKFRGKSSSWSGDAKPTVGRIRLKRLGLF